MPRQEQPKQTLKKSWTENWTTQKVLILTHELQMPGHLRLAKSQKTEQRFELPLIKWDRSYCLNHIGFSRGLQQDSVYTTYLS